MFRGVIGFFVVMLLLSACNTQQITPQENYRQCQKLHSSIIKNRTNPDLGKAWQNSSDYIHMSAAYGRRNCEEVLAGQKP